jgi:hypothetical protein
MHLWRACNSFMWPERSSRVAVLASLVFAVCLAAAKTAESSDNPPSLAVSGFFLVDTSGEPRDQTADHDARISRFDAIMQDDLSKSGEFDLVALNCPQVRCTKETQTFDQLLGLARDAGARYLAVGAINKMSSLVLWSRIEVYDVATKQMVFDRLYTFRGDNDEAWQRAAHYAAKDLIKSAAPL